MLSDTKLWLPWLTRTLKARKNRKGFSVNVLPDLLLAPYFFGSRATRDFPVQV